MPTGYTAAIKDGITFERFVWDCARAFGALVLMRDDPSGAVIPERFEPSSYYADQLPRLAARLQELRAMSAEDAEAGAQRAYQASVEYATELRAEVDGLRAKYEAMLSRVHSWQPPTTEHAGLKTFMVEQLQQSIAWDCSPGLIPEPVMKTGAEWLAEVIKDTEALERRCIEGYAEEITRTEDRNNWLKALRKSVPPPPVAA